MSNKVIQLGNITKGYKNFRNPIPERIYYVGGVSPTLNTCNGGQREPKIVVEIIQKPHGFNKGNVFSICPSITKSAWECNNFVKENTMEETINEITSNCEYRIRKLTPKECWRLMGFSDDAFDKAKWRTKEETEKFFKTHKSIGKREISEDNRIERMSNSQLLKQAGNSIVTDVLYYIFKELYVAMPYLFDDLKVGSYFSGIGAFEIGLDRLYADINSVNITSENFTPPQP